MPSITIEPNSSAQVNLKPMPLLPGQSFNFHNATNIQLTITVQGKDVQIKEAS